MITDVFRDALGGTSRRLLLTSGIPALVFSALLLGVALEASTGPGTGRDIGSGLGAAIGSWDDRSASLRTVQVAGFVLAVTLVTALLATHRGTLLRWAEGYWPGRFGNWSARQVVRHERVRAKLRTDAERGDADGYERLYLHYPLPGEAVLPTRLGNLLRSAEDYPRSRYGIDTVLVWPRLFPLLPSSFTAGFASSRARLDAALASTALSLLFAVAAPACAMPSGAPWLAALSLVAGALGALTGYRAALTTALAHGQQIRVAFDLYRGLLLDTARHGGRPPQSDAVAGPQGQPPPERVPPSAHEVLSSAAEREAWESLCGFWYRNIPPEARTTTQSMTSPHR